MVWLIVVAVLVVALLAVAVRWRARPSATAVKPPPTQVDSPPPPSAGMSALETALAEVTDRRGPSGGRRIDAVAPRPDDAGTSDDGRTLLRRALDDAGRRDVERRDVERRDVERRHVERRDDRQHRSQRGATPPEPT